MAKLYRRPLLTFYLDSPPRLAERGEDFRASSGDTADEEARLDALVRELRARQGILRAAIEDDEDSKPLDFVGSITTAAEPAAVAETIKTRLEIDLADFRQQATSEKAFELLRRHIERLGVFVLLVGNLGSYHTNFSLTTFRGMALADKYVPFIVINDNDARPAWSFTLLHELTHLWLGRGGISGPIDSHSVIEKFCNDVASEFLLPEEELGALEIPAGLGLSELYERLRTLAGGFNVSRPLLAYRLYRRGTIDYATWQEIHSLYQQEWTTTRAKQRETNRSSDGGPSFYRIRRHRIGPGLLELIHRLLQSGEITSTKAGKVLGVKPTQIGKLLSV